MPLAAKDARPRFAPLVAHVAREWRRAVDARLHVYGLTEATWLPLLRIARAESPMRQNELAASLSLDGSSVVRLLDTLESSGLIERCEDQADRRAKSLALTARGRRTVDQVERVSQDIRDVVLGEVSDEELARSLRLLETVRDRLASLGAASIRRARAQAVDRPMNLDRRAVPLWLLGLFTLSGTLGMHIFVPALPAAAKDLHATPAALELTISLYILGLAVGQLVYGPASDRFGRRPTLLVGLSLFTIASVAGLFAPDTNTLILARFFQAVGGCAGLVLARAIIRDTSQSHEAARRLALTNLLVTAGPAVAPLIGGALSSLWGWRTILVGLSAMGVANFVLAWRILPETRPEAALFVSASRYARDYFGLLRSPQFLGYAIGGGCATTSLYAFVACAPFIFVDRLHVPNASVGLYLALLVSGLWLGSLLASQLIARFSLTRFVVVANAVSVVAAASLLGLLLADRATLAGIIVTMFAFSVGVGAAAPAALVKAISVNPRVTGTASGLYGSIQMAVGAVLVALAGLGANPALASALVLLGAGSRGADLFLGGSKREPRSHRAGERRGVQGCDVADLRPVWPRAGRGSASGERLPGWAARAEAAPSPLVGS